MYAVLVASAPAHSRTERKWMRTLGPCGHRNSKFVECSVFLHYTSFNTKPYLLSMYICWLDFCAWLDLYVKLLHLDRTMDGSCRTRIAERTRHNRGACTAIAAVAPSYSRWAVSTTPYSTFRSSRHCASDSTGVYAAWPSVVRFNRLLVRVL